MDKKHNEKNVSDFRNVWLGELDKFAHVCSTHGLFSPETEDLYDDGVGALCYDGGEDVYSFMDEVADGYIIKPRTPLASAGSCWAITCHQGGYFCLVWVGSHGTAWLYADHFEYYSESRSHVTAKTHGIWPIREGFLPIPPSNKIIQE